ncbi:MAG: spore germination protein [Bacillota bacterium]|nr:spore germination protein [Bacillota bacterium]
MSLANLFKFTPPGKAYNFDIENAPKPPDEMEYIDVSHNIGDNKDFINKKLHYKTSYDITLKEFEISIGKNREKAAIYFVDGLVSTPVVDLNILEPLMVESDKLKEQSVDNVINTLVTHNQVKMTEKMKDVLDEICYGSCALFIDGFNKCILMQVIGWEKRGVEGPKTEMAIFGPQQALNESIKANTSTIRKMLRSDNLVIENLLIGEIGKTNCAVLYLSNIANPSLVHEVKKRIKSIKVDYIMTTSELEQFIEERSMVSLPQVLSTERPDRCVRALMAGKVVVMMDNAPLALIMPTTLFELLESAEDSYLRVPYSLLVKVVRLMGVIFSVFLPGFYIATILFHTYILPTGMLTTIMSASKNVPFNSVIELILMVLSFEVIREASVRVPGFLGSTLGIIGPLVLGQAAISANLISPMMIIVFSIATIGSFATPNYSIAFSARVLNLLFITLGVMGGYLGLAAGIFTEVIIWNTTKSFGVFMLSPFAPKLNMMPESIKTEPIWKKEFRPRHLKSMRPYTQAHISRGWIMEDEFEENKDD